MSARWARFASCLLYLGLVTACSGTPKAIQVSHSGAGAFEAALARDGNGFVVAWYDTRDGNAEIYLRQVDASGQVSSPERRLTETPDSSYEASVELLGDTVITAWYEQTMGGQQTAMLGAWTRDGTMKWMHPIAPSSRNPVIRTNEHAIVAAWVQMESDGTEAVYAGRWREDGQEQGAPMRVAPASKTTWNLNLDLEGDRVWVVFDAATSTRANEVYLARIDASSVRVERLTRDDGADSKYPDLRFGGDRVALTWHDMRDGNDEVYLLVGTKAELHGDIDSRALRVTNTEGESIGPYLAWNKQRLGLAWSDKTSGAHEIYFQLFDSDGMPLRSIQRITRTEAWSFVPAIQPWADGFALAWTEYEPATSETHDGTGEIFFARVE